MGGLILEMVQKVWKFEKHYNKTGIWKGENYKRHSFYQKYYEIVAACEKSNNHRGMVKVSRKWSECQIVQKTSMREDLFNLSMRASAF